MGGGSYNYGSAIHRSSLRSSQTREEIFHNRRINPEMVIKGKIRESCDSEEHPNSFPIIIALDVTGSMGQIPENLIREAFPEIMKKIQDSGVEHAQVCFIGVGDHHCDEAPIQVGQFETSDELTEKWLQNLFIEGGGGGNYGESYMLAWYTAAFHTTTDSFKKRGKKGVLITIGDEPCLKLLEKGAIQQLFGGAETDMTTSEILEAARQKWDVFHININDYASQRYGSPEKWRSLIGQNLLLAESMESEEISGIISSIIVRSYKSGQSSSKETPVEVSTTPSEESKVEKQEIKHEL